MLKPAEAWALIDAELTPLPPWTCPRDAAVWRVLAAGLAATVDQPADDVSAMDGFAFAGPYPMGAPLPVVGVAAAGRPAGRALEPGQAIRIMTGAVLPAGADRVLPVEETRPGDPEGTVVARAEAAAGDHVRRRGEVIAAGDPLLARGVLLTPGAVALAAGHGWASLEIHRPPRVAVLTTGDEIVPPDQVPGPGQLRDSNTTFLVAAGHTLGLEFENLGVCGDDPAALERAIAVGMDADVLLLCGGVSKGDFDFVEDVLARLGCRKLFDEVAIQPGKPLVIARHPGGWVCGLPGNPASVMTCFWLFVRPLLRRLQGIADGAWHGALAGRLTAPVTGTRNRDRYLPAEVTVTGGELLITPRPPIGSHDVLRFAAGTGLLRVPVGVAALAAGDRAEVLPLGHWPVG